MTFLQCVTIVALLTGVAVAKNAQFSPCDAASQATCTVTKLDIEPCGNPMACKLKSASPTSLAMSFKPKFSATNVRSGYFMASNDDLLNEASACKYTTCPTVYDKEQVITYNMKRTSTMTIGTYDIKWKVWDSADPSQQCCIKFRMQVEQ